MTRGTGFLLRYTSLLAGAVLALGIIGCDDDEDRTVNAPTVAQIVEDFDLAPLGAIPYPPDNPFNAERIALGRLLFFDPILGGESAPEIKQAARVDPYRHRANDMACATCHHPDFGFADGRRLGAGVGGAQYRDLDLGPDRVVPGSSLVTDEPVGTVPRNSPTILNAAYNGRGSIDPVFDSFQFLDGRVVGGLDAQAVLPLTSRHEMAGDAFGDNPTREEIQTALTERIRAIDEYVARFRQAFAGEIIDAADIEIGHIGRAIGAYERELVTPNSRYDQFITGSQDIFSEQEKAGFGLFFGKALCGDCHRGPMLSDFDFAVTGVADEYESILPGFAGKNGEGGDFGRFHADEVAFADQKFAFRTLTIRNVEVTGPYFHAGTVGTLRDVVAFYSRGGRGSHAHDDATLSAAGVTRHASIRPLGLSEVEIDAIVAFMRTTTAPVQSGLLGIDLTTVPERVPSGLVPPGIPTPEGAGPFLSTTTPR